MIFADCQSWNNLYFICTIIFMTKDIKKKLGKNIKKLRKQKHLSQEELSLNLDLDGSYIGKVENGKLNITIEKIANIAEFFDVEVIEVCR